MGRFVASDVLIVDDDRAILSALSREMRMHGGWSVQCADDPRQALERLTSFPPAVLIVDHSMPHLSGVELLEAARRLAPRAVRILLTGCQDREHVVDAINRGRIFRYVAKPWDPETLFAAVRDALALHAARAAEDSLQRSAQAVSAIQQALLPGSGPDEAIAISFSACELASGDYVDYLGLPSGNAALVVADVCGHGLDAALFAAATRAIIRSGLLAGEAVPDVLARANHLLCEDLPEGHFVTFFLAEHERDRGVLRFLNAGHSPLLVGPASRATLSPTSMPLGLARSATFEPSQTSFVDGDLLVAFTDGLVEARNEAGECFGLDRLAAVVAEADGRPPRAILAKIEQALAAFTAGRRIGDDVAIVLYQPQCVESELVV